MALTLEERQELLAQPFIGALSVAAGPDRAPLIVPMWYMYTPGSELWVLTGAESRKMKLLNAAGRFSLMVQRLEPTVRYVSAEGPITRVEPATEAKNREVAARYLPADKVEGYLKYIEADGSQVIVYMRPERWISADLGATADL